MAVPSRGVMAAPPEQHRAAATATVPAVDGTELQGHILPETPASNVLAARAIRRTQHINELSRRPKATLSCFPEKEYRVKPATTIEDVFAAVQSGTSTYGVVPFENSSNGSVVFTLDLFADTSAKYPDIVVTQETYLPVHHCLVGYAPSSTSLSPTNTAKHLLRPSQPGTETQTSSGQITPTQTTPSPSKPLAKPNYPLTQITKLYSHPQAWGQCKTFLSTYLRSVERQDVSSTSRAAEIVASSSSDPSEPNYTEAAISSSIAAQLNGLDILAHGIEDNQGNATRFFILRRTTHAQPPSQSQSQSSSDSKNEDEQGEEEAEAGETHKTLVSFTVTHTEAGALADCLAVFKKHRLNLTSINTRPSGVVAWNYIFFVEFFGRRQSANGGRVNAALAELGKVAKGWRWLGSFDNALLQDGEGGEKGKHSDEEEESSNSQNIVN